MKEGKFHFIELTIYYVVIFIILREWLIPISILTQTGYVELILLFVAISMAISLLKGPLIASVIIKVMYIAWFVVYVYMRQFFLSPNGLSFLLHEVQVNLLVIFSGNIFEITDPFRTVLYLLIIWMLLYLIEHWITVRMTVFYFLLFTVFFIAALDTFTVFDGTLSIVKIVILGIIMMIFLMVKRLLHYSNVNISWTKWVVFIIPVVLFVGVTSSVAVLLPKAEPQWPDPVPYLKSVAGIGDGGKYGVSKVGYDDDDTRLGGSFVADDTVVFTVQAESKQYWRVETKDIYTSKGWEKSDYLNEWFVYGPSEEIKHSLPVGNEGEMKQAAIQTLYPYDFILQPYGLVGMSYEDEVKNRNVQLLMDANTEKITPYMNRELVYFSDYSVYYSEPTYQYSNLIQPGGEIESHITNRYLQLPSTLPQRVIDLAEEIIEGKASVYEKARAVEQYFARNGFRYETTNVPVPSEGEDYVDQFLFESKIGYCDNFSTSMVVLLRSVGIPARWVKGFAGGEQIATDGKIKTYEITNNKAHSWVEAYIPNVGWMTFEPTLGFSHTRSIDFDVDAESMTEDELVVDEETEPTEQMIDIDEETVQQSKNLNSRLSSVNLNWIWILIVSVLVIITVLSYKLRKKWLPKVYVLLLKKQKINEENFEQFYLRLLKSLELQGLKRKNGQTLHDFAKEVDAYFKTNDMLNITKAYEQFIYGKGQNTIDFEQVKESWEYLINRCSS